VRLSSPVIWVLQRQGHNWRCPCPLGCGYALSLADGEEGQLLAHCFGGCGFDDVLAVLVEYALFDDDDGVASRQCEKRIASARSAEQDADRIEHARGKKSNSKDTISL
jgi:hypothetical protein